MTGITEQRLISRVSQYHASKMPFRHSKKRAAVAMVFSRGDQGQLEFLMIRRATYKGDQWSGQMAFPGGRLDPGDSGVFATVKRECQEELQLDIEQLQFVGRLSDRITRKNGRQQALLITPYVFFTEQKPQLTANYEVASVHWFPLSFFLQDKNRQFKRFRYKRKMLRLPLYYCQSCMVWGLSLAMFDELLSVYKGKGKVGRLF